MKRNIRVIYDTWSFTTVEFSNFFQVFAKTLKFHNFVNNGRIFTWFVLNDVEYEDLQLFFCVKVDFIKNKKVLGGGPDALLLWRPPARRSPDPPASLPYSKNFKVQSKP